MTTLDIRQLAEHGGVNPIAPVTVPEAVKFEDGADLNTAIGSIAVIETSPATATHTAGDYIVWNGQLYKVLADIAVGETLTLNTNISGTTVGVELVSVINAVSGNIGFTVTKTTTLGSDPLQLQTASQHMYLVYATSRYDDIWGMWMVLGSSSTARIFKITGGSGITTSSSGSVAVFSKTASHTVYFVAMDFEMNE